MTYVHPLTSSEKQIDRPVTVVRKLHSLSTAPSTNVHPLTASTHSPTGKSLTDKSRFCFKKLPYNIATG